MSLLAASLLFLPAIQGPSVKELLDSQLMDIRRLQNEDGSYGNTIRETAWTVIAMTQGPRSYREDDGPFLRNAVQNLLRAAQGLTPKRARDATVAYALHCTNAERYHTTIRGLLTPWPQLETEWLAVAVPGADALPAVEHLLQCPSTAPFSARVLACAKAAVTFREAQQNPDSRTPVFAETYESGVDFLLEERADSGLWEFMGQPEPGITALAAKALLGSARPEVVQQAEIVLDYLVSLQQKDGSIHAGNLPVYVTSVAIMALQAGGREKDQTVIQKAGNFLRQTQTDGTEGYSESDKFYGGIGYGNDLRPDLSNLQYALQGLKASGAAPDDPAFQKALLFLQRCQNRKESNTVTVKNAEGYVVEASNDGGGIYYPGNSMAGYEKLPNGNVAALSYGSMTYALLKCYVFAGLDKSDPRVADVLKWVGKNWTLEVNPGFDALKNPMAGYMGLYYYYLSLAEALSTAKVQELTTADGTHHDWRMELLQKLSELQNKDGSWVNEKAPRWWEGNPVLCTAYALNALQRVHP